MKRIALSLIAFALVLAFAGCAGVPAAAPLSYENGTYRGVYGEADNQVTIEFSLKDNIVTKISYRNLAYRGVNYRTEEGVASLRNQYQALIDHLVGKDIRDSLPELYKPGQIVDAVGGATLRSGKVISAIRDALNRGVYAY
jgi:uncharacterized lipoprotein YehR (DUF1307 family)